MDHVVLVHMLETLADLSHVFDRFRFRHLVVRIGNAIEEFATSDELSNHGHFYFFFERIV
jgi:hypothetical protein